MKKRTGFFFLLLAGLCLMGCGNSQPEPEPQEEIVEQTAYRQALADSLDEAIIVSIDQEKSSIRFYNLTLGRTYVLTYNGATGMKNKFGDEIVAGQLSEGDMVRVTFIKAQKLAKSIQLLDNVDVRLVDSDFEINKAAHTMTFDGEQYSLHKNVALLSMGDQIQIEEINPVDGLKIITRDHEVYAITVATGHGYVRLTGHDAFVDGWVEVGQSYIGKVTEEMLIPVQEGEYVLYISKDGVAGSKEIAVARDEETLVDVSELQTELTKKMGKIIFTITPASATLVIDGEEVDYSSEVELEYGIHQIKVSAEGYSTLSQYIKVGEPLANINLKLKVPEDDQEKKEEEEETSVSSNTIISSPSDYRVYIDAPRGAEMYLNGRYVGTVPLNFAKEPGTYIISLRKTGYQTRSYTLQIDDSQKDVSYSFSELTAQ